MLDQEFLAQVQEIVAACTHGNIQKAVFSATLPAGAERVALDMLRDPIRVVVGLKCVLFHFGHPSFSQPRSPTETRLFPSSHSPSPT
jgi:superfamily II DNA/RNA helicase